jgi:hypothetical protein
MHALPKEDRLMPELYRKTFKHIPDPLVNKADGTRGECSL